MAEYRLSPLALEDVKDIGFYIALDDENASIRLVNRFFETFNLIAEHPELGRKRDEFHGLRSFAIKPYVIFYRQVETCVEIVRVFHGARDILTFFQAT